MKIFPDTPQFEKADRGRRRREIALLATQNGRVTVHEIKERFGISGVTARSDLDALSGRGELIRSYGGALSPVGGNGDEQTRLAQAAIALIGPQQTIMLCAGSATLGLAKLMKTECPHRVTVITYSLQIASSLSDAPNVSLVLLGGMNRYPSGNLVGPLAEQMMRSLHAEHCFLNAPGLTLGTGITSPDMMEAHLNRQMIEAASHLTILADLKCFGHRSLALITDFEPVDRVICDGTAPEGDLAALRARGIEVVVV